MHISNLQEAMVERLPGGPRAGDRVPDFEKGDEVELGDPGCKSFMPSNGCNITTYSSIAKEYMAHLCMFGTFLNLINNLSLSLYMRIYSYIYNYGCSV